MAKIRKVNKENDAYGVRSYDYVFYCIGCKKEHGFTVGILGWDFNGDLDNPTVNPSIGHKIPMPNKTHICHSFIKSGKIEYLNDCTHELAGQTIELPEINS